MIVFATIRAKSSGYTCVQEGQSFVGTINLSVEIFIDDDCLVSRATCFSVEFDDGPYASMTWMYIEMGNRESH